MTASTLVQTRIDARLKARAVAVLDTLGLTIADVVTMLLTRIAEDGVLPFDGEIVPEAHDQWFRAKVREALDDTRPSLSHEVVEAHFAARREAARAD